MDEKREIELHNGEQPRRRIAIDAGCLVLNVPVHGADGFGQISYMASGLHTDDGVEIWTPQKWERQ
jgi:hypothetical protein